MGKSCVANSLQGKPFEDTASTVGAQKAVVKFSTANIGESGDWGAYEDPANKYEVAIAKKILDYRGATPRADQEDENFQLCDSMTSKERNLARDEVLSSEDTEVDSTRSSSSAAERVSSPAAGSMKISIEATSATSLSSSSESSKSSNSSRQSGSLSINSDAKISTNSTSSAIVANAPVSVPRKIVKADENLVAGYLSSNLHMSSNIIISMIDLGGQSKFDALRYMLMTSCGVYLVVFSMKWMKDNETKCVEELKFWLSSIYVYTYDNDKKVMPPIIIIGTFKDEVPGIADHEAISQVLDNAFEASAFWSFVKRNNHVTGARGGKASLSFFPVNNKLSNQDENIMHIKVMIQEFADKADFVRQKVPLTWLKLLDKLNETKRSYMSLAEVEAIGQECNVVSTGEVEIFLRFMSKTASLTWMEEPYLR